MNEIEKNIRRIRSDSNRFDALYNYLEPEIILSDNFIRKMLSDNYAVIRAEIIDYIISNENIHRFEKELVQTIINENSHLNFGRLRVCAALSGSPEIQELILKLNYPVSNMNDFAWYLTSIILSEGGSDKSKIMSLYCLTMSLDLSLRSLSKSLIDMFFSEFLSKNGSSLIKNYGDSALNYR